MYVVTRNGHKLVVDDSQLDGDMPFQQVVGLYTDDTVLKPIWVLVGETVDTSGHELEFKAEKIYDHEPSKEEILWFMSANGLNRYDIVYINKGYTLDME